MPLLLLVSTQMTITLMGVYETNLDLLSDKPERGKFRTPLDKEKILCIHCKRTISNGIRCLGMCVADNEY